jgi:hypothetical protein
MVDDEKELLVDSPWVLTIFPGWPLFLSSRPTIHMSHALFAQLRWYPVGISSPLRTVWMSSIFESNRHLFEDSFTRCYSFSNWELINPPSSFKDIFDIRIGVYNLTSTSTEFLQSPSYTIANITLVGGTEAVL